MTVASEHRGVKAGRRFHNRTVLGSPFTAGRFGTKNEHKRWLAVVQCDCGQIDAVQVSAILSGEAAMCRNCSDSKTPLVDQRDFQKQPPEFTDWIEPHRTLLRGVWRSMKRRCNSPKSNSYKYYGARGICVCAAWSSDFLKFYLWSLENGYSPSLSIDRIDNDGNYEPHNCRWVTVAENTRKAHLGKKRHTSSV